MPVIASIMDRAARPMYPLFFCTLQPHKQKSNGVKSGDFGGQLMVLPATTDSPIREIVTEMLHHTSDIMRRASVMLKVHSNPCSQ
jgi:hypothetical protein